MAASGAEREIARKSPSLVDDKREGDEGSPLLERGSEGEHPDVGALDGIAKSGSKMTERKIENRGLAAGEGSSNSAAVSLDEGRSKAAQALNAFKNDGSFLEFFKKKMEEEARRKKESEAPEEGDGCSQDDIEAEHENEQKTSLDEPEKKKSTLHFVGKRRGGGTKLALKTGVVSKKQKVDEEVVSSKDDAWAKYLAEVKKYKAHQCSDDDKTRPLVK